MPTTEVCSAVLLPGSHIGDPENGAAKVLKEIIDTVSKQDGCKQIHFGTEMEKPDVLRLIVEWDNFESHQTFMSQEYYSPFVEHFFTIATGPSQFLLFHVDFKPEGGLLKALSAPVTTFTTFRFQDGKPPADYESGAQKFFDDLAEVPEGFHGHSLGLSREEIEHDGVKGKAAVMAVGWESIDAMKNFHSTAYFSEKSSLLTSGMKQMESVAVQFLEFVPS